jgi:cob(I)alamin adenosyltransferase
MLRRKNKGLIIVYTGSGKGKTTAAMGLALRAVGHDLKVLMIQFIKSADRHYGEIEAAVRLYPYFEIIPMGNGFVKFWGREPAPEDIQTASETWNFSKEKIKSDEFDMIILDEINYVIDYGFLSVDDVVGALKTRPGRLHVVLTGRNAHPDIIGIADLVTEMREIKHPFKSGIKAQRGIEF